MLSMRLFVVMMTLAQLSTLYSRPLQAGRRALVSVPPLAFRGSRRRIHPTKCCRAPRAAFFDVLPGRAWVPSIDYFEAKAFGHAEAPFGPARTLAMARDRLVPLGLRWRQPRGSGRVSPCLQRPALPLFQKCAVVSFYFPTLAGGIRGKRAAPHSM